MVLIKSYNFTKCFLHSIEITLCGRWKIPNTESRKAESFYFIDIFRPRIRRDPLPIAHFMTKSILIKAPTKFTSKIGIKLNNNSSFFFRLCFEIENKSPNTRMTIGLLKCGITCFTKSHLYTFIKMFTIIINIVIFWKRNDSWRLHCIRHQATDERNALTVRECIYRGTRIKYGWNNNEKK